MNNRWKDLPSDEDFFGDLDPEIKAPKMQINKSHPIENYLNWIDSIVKVSLDAFFGDDINRDSVYKIYPPEDTYLEDMVENKLSFMEKVVLMVGLVPHLRPEIFDPFFQVNMKTNRTYSEVGGCRGNTHSGFLPTGETAAFILAGQSTSLRIDVLKIFDTDHFFTVNNILLMNAQDNDEPVLSGMVSVSSEFLTYVYTGDKQRPAYSMKFPAQQITTKLEWEDLVVGNEVKENIDNINYWIKENKSILEGWGLDKFVKSGYRSLFYGPPGTGKTLTASLLGKFNKMEVYRVDLSMLVSKYIGETEKNLANVFDQAMNKNWILFFDEADSIFGKRSSGNSSNDRHANQEVAYLLQRIEDFPGVILLATNLKSNIDDAFSRRFQSTINFAMPDSSLRLLLWQEILPKVWFEDNHVDLNKIAIKYELSGGSMTNVALYCAIKMKSKNLKFTETILVDGIRRELLKHGQII
ncbi:MAG: ATP-binding protein [Marinifilaceae bacterium]|jgi:hypothetical protein|nr:ATP-binding protein [Marinifilaceae bacterium]